MSRTRLTPLQRRLVLNVARLAVFAAAVWGWQLAAQGGGNPYFLPPSAVIPVVYRQWFDGPASHLWLTSDATANLLPSLGRMLAGLAIASVVGIALGIAIGRSALVSDLLEPVVHFARAVPPPMLVPVFLFAIGIGTPMEIASIVFGVLWPVLLNAIDGARQVHPVHLETARAFKIPPLQRMTTIILPSAAPKIVAGLRVGVALALVMMIVSEFVGSLDGIGRELVNAQNSGKFSLMWAIIIILGLLGVIFNLLLTVAERRVLAWQQTSLGGT